MRTVSGSQTITSARDEIYKPAVAEILQLLAYLRPDVLVAGIEAAEMPLESVDLVERELALAKGLHAFHDVEQPAPRFQRFIPEEKRFLPFRENQLLCTNDAVLHDVNLARLRYLAEQDFRADPAGAPCGRRQRRPLLDDIADEKVLRHDEQVNDRKRLEVVIHQQQIWVVVRRETLAFRVEFPVENFRAEFALLALEFEFLAAGTAEEIRQRAVVRKRRNPRIAAMRTIRPRAHPRFGPGAGVLRAAGEERLGFFEAEFHQAKVAGYP